MNDARIRRSGRAQQRRRRHRVSPAGLGVRTRREVGVERALRVSGGTAADVGLPGADGSRATGINDAAQVTGYSGWTR